MSKREWMVLGAVFAVVAVAIWFEPDSMTMSEPGGDGAMVMEATIPSSQSDTVASRTVTLAVSGMT